MHKVSIGDFRVGKEQPLAVISGPCIIESREHALACARKLKEISEELSLNLIFKASYDKANRSSLHSFRGPGVEEGLDILQEVKETFHLAVTTDVHEPNHAEKVGKVCDILQIPAFLCRQTDLIIAAAETQKVVNVKKGQFLAPWDMKNIVDKITSCGNHNIILTDRGVTFGYNNLVSDMRAMPIMEKLGYPVCFDASHSAQLPGGLGSSTGGQREFIPTLAKAAIAAGAHILFIESHPDPCHAKSDATTVYPLEELKPLLALLIRLHSLVQQPVCLNAH